MVVTQSSDHKLFFNDDADEAGITSEASKPGGVGVGEWFRRESAVQDLVLGIISSDIAGTSLLLEAMVDLYELLFVASIYLARLPTGISD